MDTAGLVERGEIVGRFGTDGYHQICGPDGRQCFPVWCEGGTCWYVRGMVESKARGAGLVSKAARHRPAPAQEGDDADRRGSAAYGRFAAKNYGGYPLEWDDEGRPARRFGPGEPFLTGRQVGPATLRKYHGLMQALTGLIYGRLKARGHCMKCACENSDPLDDVFVCKCHTRS
jgi:hypothetical protein